MSFELTTLDILVFVAALVGVMAVGLIVGRKEKTSEDYFLAGRKLPWWGVAGSIFGSNVSANHMVGMMGVGFTFGFAQSHFELGAIFGLLFLCYGFLPVYRKLGLYTLSEYLERRYDTRSRLCYAVIMIVIMVLVQMVPGLYIGGRVACILVGGPAMERSLDDVAATENGDDSAVEGESAKDGAEASSGLSESPRVDATWYTTFVIALAVISALYTIFGGLTAVVWTDVIQSTLLLAAGMAVAFLTFREVGGWDAMMAQGGADRKMSLYRPTTHPALPWTGVFTGLIAMHLYYWGTNQFIVQRALGARSDEEARLGIIAAGFLKLTIPFFAIAAGVAAFYYLKDVAGAANVDSDAVFAELVNRLISPLGFGLVGLIMAGLIGAILSSIDSMMNSSATIFSVDIYKRYFRPEASDKEMILVGRISIVCFVTLATVLALVVMDPNSKSPFFLLIADYQNYFTPGLLVAFLAGMFWKRTTALAALVTIVGGVVFSWGVEATYNTAFGMNPTAYAVLTDAAKPSDIQEGQWPQEMEGKLLAERVEWVETQRANISPVNLVFGPKLAFFHRVFIVIVLCTVLCVSLSLIGTPTAEQSALTWTELGGHAPSDLSRLGGLIGLSILLFAALFGGLWAGFLSPLIAGLLGGLWTALAYVPAVLKQSATRPLWKCDRLYAAVLCTLAVFVHFYFY